MARIGTRAEVWFSNVIASFARYVVERTLAGFSQFRRIKMCYERRGEHFQAFHDLAACCLIVTRLKHYELQF